MPRSPEYIRGKISELRELLIVIERLENEDQQSFGDLIGGICIFLENELERDS